MASDAGDAYDKPEARARREIDRKLATAGWTVQSYRDIDLGASLGVAVREVRMVSAAEIAEDLEAALSEFAQIAESLKAGHKPETVGEA
jgi:hypothetical protein